ncbi:hypothetical protein [Plantactinospora sp. WMMB782]|uniref:hypothetical protein n=1 Tax=Plantactinospora sp. WMMB782 TaxID=3404121 RepID=UPI003B952AA0
MGDKTAEVHHRGRLGWRGQAASALLGVTVGVGINQASDLGPRVLAITAAGTAVVMVTNWLRGLPPRAPVVLYSIPILLCLAATSVLLTLILSGAWAGVAILTSVGFMAGAILLASAVDVAVQILTAAASLGLGTAVVAGALATLQPTWGSIAFSCYISFFGLLLMLAGLRILRGRGTMRGTQIVGIGVIGLGGAIAGLLHGADVLFALIVITNGVVLVLDDSDLDQHVPTITTVAIPLREYAGITWSTVGLVSVGGGVWALLHGHHLDGWAAIMAGVAGIGAAVAILKRTDLAEGVGAIALGVVTVVGGLLALSRHTEVPRNASLVLTVAVVGTGLGTVAGGASLLQRAGLLHRVNASWRHLTGDLGGN